MPSHPDFRTVLFADICGSTAMYEKLGDATAQQLISKTLALMTEEVEAKGGRVVKIIGDEIMACFWHPIFALDAAKAILFRLSFTPREPGIPLVAVHMGMIHGPVLQHHGDLFGDAVNLASRLTALAKPWQLLTTQATIATLGSESEDVTRLVIRAPIRGKTEEVDLFEVVWDNAEMTSSSEMSLPTAVPGRLVLRLKDQTLEVNRTRPVATLGRGDLNDLVAGDKGVSRWHARIEMRRGKWFLVDMSTNGTYVHGQGKPLAFVNYEEHLLPAAGFLVLGRASDPAERVTIFFAEK